MVFEVACASCGGRMMVEHPGSIIACPHCGEQLKSPEEESANFDFEELSSGQPSESEPDATLAFDSSDSSISFPGLPEDPSDPRWISPNLSFEVEGTPVEKESENEIDLSETDSGEIVPSWEGTRAEGEGAAQRAAALEESASSVEEIPSAEPHTRGRVTPSDTESERGENGTGNSSLQEAVISPPADSRTVSRLKYVLVASYASAVTIAFVYYLWMTLGKADPHQLESLPDVVPKEKATGEIERIVVSENAQMPKGHSLKLGQSQRYGSLLVTPLKVTRGPLEFVHHTGDFTLTKPPAGPVLKLWLRFKNVSEKQEFMPLGADLVFYRGRTDRYPEKMRANNFVCRVDEKLEDGNQILMYDHVIEDVWDLKGQKIERGLKPGDEFETYLPSSEVEPDELTGQLIWRVHLRKGLNPKTGWGITTLVEVEFHSDAIEDETVDQEVR